MKRAMIALSALSALSTLLLLAACGPSTTSTTTTSRSETATASTAHTATATARALGAVCPNLALINQSLTSLSTITATTPVGKVQATHSTLTSALGRLGVLLPSNEAPMLTDVQTASTQLATTLKSAPATATMGQTGIDLHVFTSQAAAAHGDVTRLASALNCSS